MPSCSPSSTWRRSENNDFPGVSVDDSFSVVPICHVMAWQLNLGLITPRFRNLNRSESSINCSAAPPSAVCVHASHAVLAPAFFSHSSSLHTILKTHSLAGDQDQVHSPQHCSSPPHNPHIAGVCFSSVCLVRNWRNALKWSRLVGLIARCGTAEHDAGVFCRRWVGQMTLPTTHNLVCGVLGRAVANSTLQGGRRP